MSKPIRLTEENLKECRSEFERALTRTKMTDGFLSFTKSFSCDGRKATVFFTANAISKMVMLIRGFDKEIAWHGTAYRGEDENKDEYIIDDILVYPQEVTGATVEMDTETYALWLAENAEDDRFNNIHMQGHSHVNMAVNPSSTDIEHQKEILNMLDDENFYIFMIWNKSFSSNIRIYDLKKNVFFENSDVTVRLFGADGDLSGFMEEAEEMVRKKGSPQMPKFYSCSSTSSSEPGFPKWGSKVRANNMRQGKNNSERTSHVYRDSEFTEIFEAGDIDGFVEKL